MALGCITSWLFAAQLLVRAAHLSFRAANHSLGLPNHPLGLLLLVVMKSNPPELTFALMYQNKR